MALNEIHAILKRTRYGTGSQWRLIWVMVPKEYELMSVW